MSFGFSGGDIILLTQLAWNVVQGARKACGEYDELTRELSSLHTVLQRLRRELTDVESPVLQCDSERREELEAQVSGCESLLKLIDTVLTKYNGLEDCVRSSKKLWKKIGFGNGEMKDLAEIRLKICAHTQAITMSLNLISLGSQGRIETQLSCQGKDVSGIRESVNWIVAKMAAAPEASVMTSYSNDSKVFWRELRRELVGEGYPSSVIQKHKSLIKAYVKELGDRGVLDEHSEMYSEPLAHVQPKAKSPTSNLTAPHVENQVIIETDDLESVLSRSHLDKNSNQKISKGDGLDVEKEELLQVKPILILDEETTMDTEGIDQAARSNWWPVCGTDKNRDLNQIRNSLTSGGPPDGDANSQTCFTMSNTGNGHFSSGQCMKNQQFLKDYENSENILEQLNTSPSRPELEGIRKAANFSLSERKYETKAQLVNLSQTSASSESSISANTQYGRASETDDKSGQTIQLSHPNLSKDEGKIEEPKYQMDAPREACADVTRLVLSGLENISILFHNNSVSLSTPGRSMRSSTNEAGSALKQAKKRCSHQLLEGLEFEFWDFQSFCAVMMKLRSPQDLIQFIEGRFEACKIAALRFHKEFDAQYGTLTASKEWRSVLGLGLWIGVHAVKRPLLILTFKSSLVKKPSLEAPSTKGNAASDLLKTGKIFVEHWANPFKIQFPWDSRISWEFVTETLRFIYFNFGNYRYLFEGGHFDLLDPEGKMIRPELWSSHVQPGWTITLAMRQPCHGIY